MFLKGWLGDRCTRNDCNISACVWFWDVGLGGGPESFQNHGICLVLESWLGGGALEIIAKSKHLHGFGMLAGGRVTKNHCWIKAFVWIWEVGLGVWGTKNHFQNQCICIVLEGWLWGRGTRNHLQNQCICKVLKRLVAGLVAPESLQNQYRWMDVW